MQTADYFPSRVSSLKLRTTQLGQLKTTINACADLNAQQWAMLESSLNTLASRILKKLQRVNDHYLPKQHSLGVARKINAILGQLELDLAKAYNFFDTYMDVLTQRLSPELGSLLSGCDVLAYDAMVKNHPSLASIERPLVYCDRGFGASIIREGVPFYGLTANPFPLIQIPYAKLRDKCNLISVLHEVGHQTLVRLGLNKELPLRLKENLKKQNAPETIQGLYALWCSEIGPDFWAFTCSGTAQAAAIREILNLPPAQVFRLNWGDPHPPPYIRVLISFAWCKEFFGRGDWDQWQEAWKALYPLELQENYVRDIYQQCIQYIPVLIHTLVQQKWQCLQNQTWTSLFDMTQISPAHIQSITQNIQKQNKVLDFRNTPPCTQLAVFRAIKDKNIYPPETLDKLMSQWLVALSKRFKN